jgi:hypothetical protein
MHGTFSLHLQPCAFAWMRQPCEHSRNTRNKTWNERTLTSGLLTLDAFLLVIAVSILLHLGIVRRCGTVEQLTWLQTLSGMDRPSAVLWLGSQPQRDADEKNLAFGLTFTSVTSCKRKEGIGGHHHHARCNGRQEPQTADETPMRAGEQGPSIWHHSSASTSPTICSRNISR